MVPKTFFAATGLVIATTVGAGIFALPAVFYRAGILTGFIYLVFIAGAVGIVHLAYYDVLHRLRERHQLLGLVREYVGAESFRPAFLVIIGGLFLALTAYLIIGEAFLHILFPTLSYKWSLILFWITASFPVLFGFRRLAALEFIGALLMLAVVLFVHVSASFLRQYPPDLVLVNPMEMLLPLGPLIFAFAGWTAIEPIFTLRGTNSLSPRLAKRAIILGTVISAFIYLVFVLAILGSGGAITPDTLSGLAVWGHPKLAVLALFGLFAIWTSYWPMSLEIRDSLERDVGQSKRRGMLLVLLLPLALILAGIRNFLGVVEFVGGVFLGLQYVCILLIAKKVLTRDPVRRLGFNLLLFLFSFVAVYQISSFVLHYVL